MNKIQTHIGLGRIVLLALFLNICILKLHAQMDIQNIELRTIQGDTFTLADYHGKVVILVNTASECGFTPQLEDLQYIQDKYGDEGLQIIGFPSNDFAGQEPLKGMEIVDFCQKNYGVSFPFSVKIHVKGENDHPLYKKLTEISGSDVSWNFQKFIIDKQGHLVKSIPPKTRLVEEDVIAEIEKLL